MILEMKQITKHYGSLVANDNVSLTLEKGEILAICGENGAGKSTIMKILYGLERPTAGEILINGQSKSFRSPQDAIQNGIGMVQQHFMLFDTFTVAENIVYSKEPKRNGLFFDRKKANQIVRKLSERYGLSIDPESRVRDCPVGLQQRIEILKVLYQDAEIIIFDEPSAVLTPQEVTELLETIRGLATLGKSIILITHKLHEVMEVADRILVMRGGKHIACLNKADTSIEELSYLMVGRHIIDKVIEPQQTAGKVLEINDLWYKDERQKDVLKGFSLHVDAGEIVGLAGVSGNGQSELIECITGLRQPGTGSIRLQGQAIEGLTVDGIRRAGCACIPEDRYLWGCAKKATLTETCIMNHHKSAPISRKGIVHHREANRFSQELLETFGVRFSSISQKAGELSGGNLQKAIVARELAHNTKFLIAAEPTRGVDVGAMEFIHDTLIQKREQGDAILLISSELSEILTLSDRIYVICEGRAVAEFTREEADSEKLGIYMMGGKLDENR